MLHLTSGPALVVEFGLAVFCFIDALISPEPAVRWVPRWGWVVFLLVFPLCGSILWLVAGHPWRSRVRAAAMEAAAAVSAGPADRLDLGPSIEAIRADAAPPEALRSAGPSTGPGSVPPSSSGTAPGGGPADGPGPSPDATLAEELWAIHEEHERTLRAWESDLRRREAALQGRRSSPAV